MSDEELRSLVARYQGRWVSHQTWCGTSYRRIDSITTSGVFYTCTDGFQDYAPTSWCTSLTDILAKWQPCEPQAITGTATPIANYF